MDIAIIECLRWVSFRRLRVQEHLMQRALRHRALLLLLPLAHASEPVRGLVTIHVELEYAEVEDLIAPEREE